MRCAEGTREGDDGNVRRRREEGTGSRARTRRGAYLRVRRVLKRVEDLLQRDGVPRFLIDGFPDDAVRLRGARRRSARFRRPRCATPGRKANDSSVAYPFPQLLLDLILPQHVLVYLFAHDSCSRARSALERRRRAARLRVGLSRFPNGSLFFARLFCENELTTVTVLAAASTRTRRSCLTRLSRHSAPAVPSRKLSSALDMNGRITDTSIALRLVNFTPLSAFSSSARKPA